MGIFDDIGKELEKALKPNSPGDSQYITKITSVKKEYEDTIFYLHQLEKKKEDNGIDQATYESLSSEYQQKKNSLLEKLDQYREKYATDKSESESIIKRTTFEKSEIYSQLVHNTSDFSSDSISEEEYQARKKELELKSKTLDTRFENAKKTLKTLDSVSSIFNEIGEDKK